MGGGEAIGGGIGTAAVIGAFKLAEVALKRRARRRPKRELDLDERRLLSSDEQTFRKSLLDQLAEVRDELAKCQRQHAQSISERLDLSLRLTEASALLADQSVKLAETRRELERVKSSAVASGLVLDPEVTHP